MPTASELEIALLCDPMLTEAEARWWARLQHAQTADREPPAADGTPADPDAASSKRETRTKEGEG